MKAGRWRKMDTVSKEKRSQIMGRIRSKDTKPELAVRSWLHMRGFRFRLHSKALPGHPDVVLRKHMAIVEVRGCFWHHHEGCAEASVPKSNRRFWKDKLRRNMERDAENERQWREAGWNVIVVWGCELRHAKFEETMREVERRILAGTGFADATIAAEAAAAYDATPPTRSYGVRRKPQ